MAVDVLGECELRELRSSAADDTRKIHHLGEPDHAPSTQERIEVAGAELAAWRLEPRRRHARRRHEVDVERQSCGRVEQPVNAVGAEHVRDLMRIGDDRCRPEREHEPCELVDEQLRRLEVHVRVDEAGHHPAAACVERLAPLVGAEARDPAVDDRHVRLEPLAREDREHLAAAHDEIRGLVPARHREALRKGCVHWTRTVPFPSWKY